MKRKRLGFVAAGAGVALVPELALANRRDVVAVRLAPPAPARRLLAARREAAPALAERLRDVARGPLPAYAAGGAASDGGASAGGGAGS